MQTQLPLDVLRTDGGTQPRTAINWTTVAEYAEDMAQEAAFPPVVVYHDGADYWLADGFHRYHAAVRLELPTIDAEVRPGTLAEAQWYSYSVNQSHGLRRTNEDKRRAVEAALQHPYAGRYSGEQIAKHCGVSNAMVSRYRESISYIVRDEPQERTVTRNGTTYTMQTGNIGRGNGHIMPEPLLPVPHPLGNALKNSEMISSFADDEEGQGAPAVYQPMAATVYSHRSVEYYTPVEILEAARDVLGAFDLDPASCPEAQENVRAARYFTQDEDGLTRPWYGRVWLNPPYGKTNGRSNQEAWSQRLVSEYQAGHVTGAILLVKAALGYKWFEELFSDWPVCFVRSRLSFILESGDDDGQSKQGTALFYFGDDFAKFAQVFRAIGRIIPPEDQLDITMFG